MDYQRGSGIAGDFYDGVDSFILFVIIFFAVGVFIITIALIPKV